MGPAISFVTIGREGGEHMNNMRIAALCLAWLPVMEVTESIQVNNLARSTTANSLKNKVLVDLDSNFLPSFVLMI